MVKLLVFAASHRKDSINRRLAKYAADEAAANGASIDFAEYGDFDMPIYDDGTYDPGAHPATLVTLAERLKTVDGFIIASPEYNWSYPGSLKNIIDWLSRITPSPLLGKTAFLVSASPSIKGGALGLVHLRVPLEALDVYVHPQMFALSRAHEAWDGGMLKEPKQQALLKRMVKAYIGFTQAMADAKT